MVRLLRARALARLRPVDDPRCTPLPGEALGLWPVPAIPPRLASPAAPARARAHAPGGGGRRVSTSRHRRGVEVFQERVSACRVTPAPGA